jgi:transposase
MDRPVVSSSDTKHYRRHSTAFKLALVEQTLQPGASVAHIAREHGVNANQVFGWRKLHREGCGAN